MKARARSAASWLFCAATLYLLLCSTIYSLRNPERTQTQLFLELPRALCWEFTPPSEVAP